MLAQHTELFDGRYVLVRVISKAPDHELWEARDTYGGPIIVKAWPFHGKPTDEERALWNAELRHLFRLASLPRSEDHLVVLRDAGIDVKNGCFVMSMMSPGMHSLEAVLADRAKHDWLRTATKEAVRADLWRGIRRLASGLVQLHQQQMLHRAVALSSIFVDPQHGPSTMRLGGFEWTVRLGSGQPASQMPLRRGDATYSFESDWFALGIAAAKIVGAAGDAGDVPTILLRLVANKHITDHERHFLEQLLADDIRFRLGGYEVLRRIDQIVRLLDEAHVLKPTDYLGLVVLLGPGKQLTLEIITQNPDVMALDLESQRQFIEHDIVGASLVRVARDEGESFALVGRRLTYRISSHVQDDGSGGAWDLAFSGSLAEVRSSLEDEAQTVLQRLPIKVFTLRAFRKDETVVRQGAVAWKPYLPAAIGDAREAEALQSFHDFFRVTNQIELLMRDAEVFPYEIYNRRIVEGAEEIDVRETARKREMPQYAKISGGLTGYLTTARNDKQEGGLVYLGEEESLDVGREVPRPEFWDVVNITSEGAITLRRPKATDSNAVPQQGFLRSFEMFGQMSLIRRRRRAIERLANHAYLLRALQTPGYGFLDTGERALPRDIPETNLDEAKRSAMLSIWRTRPIFALQGPPGTGKTTLVANLLAQIFADDSVAQVLVTAQAHAAVDVLRDKVRKEIGDGRDAPLAIRFSRTRGDESPDPDYVDQVAQRMLQQAINEIQEEQPPTALQLRWVNQAQIATLALARGDTEGHARDLRELVQRAAGITYCTTTAGDLAQLADSTQTFDWSIIEEAGKAHGFDLALPLQTGHRWLLIGDQKQLPPYRFEDFRKAILNIDETFKTLWTLPRRGGGQVDVDLLLRWQKDSSAGQARRQQLWLKWLPFFECLHETCGRIKLPPTDETTNAFGAPVLAEMLSQQHRMHPSISDLVSQAYYAGGIESMTVDDAGRPLARVLHPFTGPSDIAGRAIVWIDTPWVSDGGTGEAGNDAGGRYTSSEEIDAIQSFIGALRTSETKTLSMAVLSPYRRQVTELNRRLRANESPAWLRPQHAKGRRAKGGLAATVDSFQGDQADIVIVSLVRNNAHAPGAGLGFLQEARRMNVLFSRAERLLVLVGSLEFFKRQLRDVPPDGTQPLGHWRLALEYLDECFESGAALLIPAAALPRPT